MMRKLAIALATTFAVCAAVEVVIAAPPASPPAATPTAATLKRASDFSVIVDPAERSAAIFVEAGKVINSPRCLNCHPGGRSPTQGNDLHPHVPYMSAGVQGHGQKGLQCAACHQSKNVDTQGAVFATLPGHEHWGLAPSSMAWQGKSLSEICQQIKDRSRNGNRSLAQLHEHMGKDSLVGWAWHPGEGREPAPGSQQAFGELIAAWIETGAVCPG